MTKYLLTDFELNGYDDSDFVCTYFDDVTKQVHAHKYGTTRAAAPTMIGWNGNVSSVVIDGEACLYPTPEAVEGARVWLEEYLLLRLQRADVDAVDQPQVKDLHEGLVVRLKEGCRYALTTSEPCHKCAGSGKWINPKNPSDARDCFGCKGTGAHITGKAKDTNGKQLWQKLTAGQFGAVVDWRSFGTFYANGCNRPGPSNTTVQFRLDSGEIVRAGLSKLRLHREYQPIETLRAKVYDLSLGLQFSAIYPRHAWDTHNYARKVTDHL
jgi:hypothetical protein